jgi:hypothetical protein
MGEMLSAAQRAYRTFITDGVHASGRDRPSKPETVNLFRLVENRMALNPSAPALPGPLRSPSRSMSR